jgi:hypothetical protein
MRILENIIKRVIKEELSPKLTLLENVGISDNLKYHIDNNINLSETIFRVYSDSYFSLINEVRELYFNDQIRVPNRDLWIIESDLGKSVILEDGRKIWLDVPFEIDEQLNEAKHRGKDVKLNKPFRTPGGSKKFAVYVKTPKGTIKKVTFGDPNLRVRNANKKAAKSFRARHKCDQKKDRTTAGYWSCNVGRYAKSLGIVSKNKW